MLRLAFERIRVNGSDVDTLVSRTPTEIGVLVRGSWITMPVRIGPIAPVMTTPDVRMMPTTDNE